MKNIILLGLLGLASCDATLSFCGDGVQDVNEDCDEGDNNQNGGTCEADCTLPSCGNGVLDANEQCDDGNLNPNDGCSSACFFEGGPSCGNGVIDANEQCDDNNNTSGDGCSATCQIEAGPLCGNGVIDANEQCDDGNITSGDGCSASCATEVASCPAGLTCVTAFPFHDDDDTSLFPAGSLNGYSCAANTNEGGSEKIYRVTVPTDGFLSAAVHDGAGVDVDVHILSALNAGACLDRGDREAKADVSAGEFFIVVDTFVSGGVEQSGAYALDIGFIAPSSGPCDLEIGTMSRIGDGGNALAMPATGPIVLEAHLVTQAEPAPFPATATDELDAHYALSQQETGLVMFRDQVWAPLEGGGFFGAGIGDPAVFPVLDEGWYVNMMWASSSRPAKGTKMILRDPNGGSRAVVVAAGYETGPGDLSRVGGTPEETHFYMGTTHLDVMTLGIAIDQSIPFGPRVCQ